MGIAVKYRGEAYSTAILYTFIMLSMHIHQNGCFAHYSKRARVVSDRGIIVVIEDIWVDIHGNSSFLFLLILV